MQRKWLKTEGRIRKYDPAWVPDKSSRERLDALLKIWQVTAYSITNAPIRGHPGGGGDSGEPPVICTTTFTNPPQPKPRLFN